MDELMLLMLDENKSKAKSLSDYEEIVKKSGMIWKKPHEYNNAIAGETNFDDFFKLAGENDAKLCKFIVKCIKRSDESIEYVRSLQFFYKSPSGRIIEGVEQMHPAAPSKGTLAEQVFELDDDEYPIKIIGNTGLFLDSVGFETSKGRKLKFGGNGGGPRELEAPTGLHFTRFGSIHCDGGVFSLLAESSIIPNKNQENKQMSIDFDQLGAATKYIIDCLSLKDIFTLFRLNRYFASWRHSPIFLNRLAKRIIYTCNIQTREYIEEIMKSANSNFRSIQKIQKLLDITKNQIKNPFGEQQFEGFKITKNGGNQIKTMGSNTQNYRTSCFITSFAYCELQFKAKLSDLFDQEFLDLLNSRNACLVGGCYMKQLGFGAELFNIEINTKQGYVRMIIKDEKANKELSNLFKQDKSLTKAWQQFFVKFEKEESDNKFEATTVELYVGGKDTCFWGGHYGNIMSGITLRGLPFYSRKDKALVDI